MSTSAPQIVSPTPEQPGSSTTGGPPEAKKETTFREALPGLIILLCIGAITIAGVWLSGGFRTKTLEIVASAELTSGPMPAPENKKPAAEGDESSWLLKGVVLDEGKPVTGATVRAIAKDVIGNRYDMGVKTTTDAGGFQFDPFAAGSTTPSRGRRLNEIAITAKRESFWYGNREGEEVLHLAGQQTKDVVEEVQPQSFLGAGIVALGTILLVVFATSIGVAYASRKWPHLYYISVVLAFVFTFAMVGFIGWVEMSLSSLRTKGDGAPLGFAYVFKGTYVRALPPDLLISLTAPPPVKAALAEKTTKLAVAAQAADPAANAAKADKDVPSVQATAVEEPAESKGFGAPLWVVLLAVIGSALFTVTLIVKEIREPLNPQAPGHSDDHIGRIQKIVEHQFFILFSPLGGIFLYQLLLLAGAASQPVTVAVAALSSGLMLNYLLAKALATMEGLFKRDEPVQESSSA